jgi:YVTN family beta-propeller protein
MPSGSRSRILAEGPRSRDRLLNGRPARVRSGRWTRTVATAVLTLTVLALALPSGTLAFPWGAAAPRPVGHPDGAASLASPRPALPQGGPRAADRSLLSGSGCSTATDCRPVAASAPTGGNASPVDEYSRTIGSQSVGSDPYGIAFDPANNYTYVANANSNNVTILNGTTVVANVAVGVLPEGAFYDPGNGEVYVSNRNSNSVTVLNGTTVAKTYSTAGEFNAPYEMAYDPLTGDVYVANVNAKPGFVTLIAPSGSYTTVNTGTYPAAALYDPANGYVYIANAASAANGGASVTVLNGTKLVKTVTGSFSTPIGMAYDPRDGDVYVANSYFSNPSQGSVAILNGTTVVKTLTVGGSAWDAVFDPVSGWVYVADEYSSQLSILSGLSVAHTLNLSAPAYNLAVENGTGSVLVPESTTNKLVVYGVGVLSLGPSYLVGATGNPATSLEVGVPGTVDTEVLGVGALPDLLNTTIVPSSGLGCAASAVYNGSDPGAGIALACTPLYEGSYTVWENLTDAVHALVWSWVNVSVVPSVTAGPLSAEVGVHPVVGGIDANESFNVSAPAIMGGTGQYTLTWQVTGEPGTPCTGGAGSVSCSFPVPGNAALAAQVTDTDGGSVTSPALRLIVATALSAGTVSANRSIGDAGETVMFNASPVGGSGAYAFLWSGVPPAACAGQGSPSIQCTLAEGVYAVGVTVSDSNYGSASAALPFTVSGAIVAGAPEVSRDSLDVGQSFSAEVNDSGGSAPLAVQWGGLPNGCLGRTSPTVSCSPVGAGHANISYAVTDASGATAPSPTVMITISAAMSVAAPTSTPDPATVGQPVTLKVVVLGGNGAFAYTWSGLPAGCSPLNASRIACTPTASATDSVEVSVVDGNGASVASPVLELTVSQPSTGSTGTTSTILGLSPLVFGALVAVLVAVAALGLFFGMRGRRRPPTAPPPRASRAPNRPAPGGARAQGRARPPARPPPPPPE